MEALLAMIDGALVESEQIEGRLNKYDGILQHVQGTIHKMADKNKQIHQTNQNNSKLLAELQQVLVKKNYIVIDRIHLCL